MIYVPNDEYSCYVVQDKDTIRAYHTRPYSNSTISYTDYFINSHYLERTGQQSFGNYAQLPTCISNENITSNVFYRNDFDNILVIFFLIVIFVVVIPTKVVFRFFRRFVQ